MHRFLVAIVIITLFIYSAGLNGYTSISTLKVHSAEGNSILYANAKNDIFTYYISGMNSSYSGTSAIWMFNNNSFTGTVRNTTLDFSYPVGSQDAYYLFKPGDTNNISNGSIPAPSNGSAWGWSTYLSGSNYTIPGGRWNFSVGVDPVQIPATSTGNLTVGLKAYKIVRESSKYNFSVLFDARNSTNILKLRQGSIALLNMSVNSGRVTVPVQGGLFIEYYVYAYDFSSVSSVIINLADGGANGSEYNFSYPYMGWVSGQIYPAGANITLDGIHVVQNQSGTFNFTVFPGTVFFNASMSGFSNYSAQIDVTLAQTVHLAVSLKKLYELTITENGLRQGTMWSASANGEEKNSSGNSLIFMLENGTYNIVVNQVPGYKLSPFNSSVMINGSNASIRITFTEILYRTVFTERGLPPDKVWGIETDNQTNYSISDQNVFYLPNGSYTYTIMEISGFAPLNRSGTFKVIGGPLNITVTFREIVYNVTFIETGLPQKTEWSVIINSTALSSDAASLSFTLPNGTYNYSVGRVGGYRAATGTGKFVVNGSSIDIFLYFNQVKYAVSFYENGLPGGTNWSVHLGNETFYSKSDEITFYVPNGTYRFTVSNVKGFKTDSSSGTVFVQNSSVTQLVFFSRIPPPSISLIYFIIIVIVIVQAELIGSFFYYRRKGQRKDAGDGLTNEKKVRQIVADGVSMEQSEGKVSLPAGAVNSAGSAFLPLAADISPPPAYDIDAVLQRGSSCAIFEEKSENAMEIFGRGLKLGLKGLMFTREYPEKVRQKYQMNGANIIWLTNLGGQESIRPKDLEKITLQCNDFLTGPDRMIMIEGLEYLITNNGFITVLKLIQFLRDTTSVNKSVLLLALNPSSLGENELSLLKKEVDRIIEL